ncbi:MAG: hypothetical protein FWH02_07905 [Oscillospiraceae bacterium]|nr:hypothetical protein [Oscillospiraceae bacterium]
MKKIIAIILLLCLSAGASLPVFAAVGSRGFTRVGGYSDSRVSFGFETDEAVVVYNGDVLDWADFGRVTAGSSIYIPIHIMDWVSGTDAIAAERDIRDNAVGLAWVSHQGERFVDGAELVDGRRERISGLPQGAYAKIALNNDYHGQSTMIVELDLVLSVNRLSYPATQISLRMGMANREITVDRGTVYTAAAPTQFQVSRNFRHGDVTFDFGGGVQYTVAVNPQDSYFLHLSREEDPVIAEMYPDSYLEYYNFLGDRDTFSRSGELAIPIDRAKFIPRGEQKPQVYVYRVQRGNELRALDESVLSFDSARNILTVQTRELGYYILSDRPLQREIEGGDDDVIFVGYAPVDTDPEEGGGPPEMINQNPMTGPSGPVISAANTAAYNPPTSDTAPLAPIILCLLAAGFAAAGVWKKGVFAKSNFQLDLED